jgi:hypothetical protein
MVKFQLGMDKKHLLWAMVQYLNVLPDMGESQTYHRGFEHLTWAICLSSFDRGISSK